MSAYLFIFAAAVLWGLIGVVSKGLLDAGLSPLEIAFWRACLGGLAFGLHAAFRGGIRLERGRDALAFAGFALVGVTLFYASLVFAIAEGGISLAFILLYSAPAFVALLAWRLLGESLTPRKLGLIALALLGVLLVAGDSGEGVRATPTSLAWGLTSGLSYASYYVFGKWALERYPPTTIYAFVLPLGALGLLPFVTFAPKTLEAWLLLGFLALVSTYLAYWLYYTGLRHAEASRAVLVATVEPVVAALLAALVYGERFGVFGFSGSACILAASLLAARSAGSGPPQRSGR